MNHVYLKTHMGASHRALAETLEADGKTLRAGDVAVFVNNAFTAVKVLYGSRAYIYVRQSVPLTLEELARSPTLVGAKPIVFTERELRVIEKEHPKVKRRRVGVAA